MDSFKILLTASPWLLPVCLAAGALYAWLLYSKKTPWSKNINYALAALRFVVVSFLSFLLLGPFVRSISNTAVKPTIVLAVDNSQSVGLFTDSATLNRTKAGLQSISNNLKEKDFDVEIRTFDEGRKTGNVREVKFDAQSTDLDQLLTSVQRTYANRNLAGVVLVSDGIINKGQSPTYADFNYTIFPVALGDTIPKKDISLVGLQYNKVAYSGNRFPLIADIRAEGFTAGTASVLLKENGKVIDSKKINLAPNRQNLKAEFTLTSAQPGKKHYEVVIEPISGEFTTLNNSKHAYIDIVKGRLKVLVAAAAAHPDIKALRSAIETNENFEFVLYLPGIKPLKPDNYDMVILHQIPNRNRLGQEALDLVKNKKLPVLYFIGAQSDLQAYNLLNAGLVINKRSNQTDEVTPVINPQFVKFRFEETATQRFENFPPADVPFADFRVTPKTEVILRQQVGKVKTEKPLLTYHELGDQRTATWLADGTWQWRLQEAAENQASRAFDKLVINLVQLLTTKASKKRLDVFPLQDSYVTTDEIRFEAVAYNEIFEKIYGQTVNLNITGEDSKTRSYSFVNGEGMSGVTIGNLPGGVYRYAASANINGTVHRDNGEFMVEELQLEALNAQADHNLLYQLAKQTGSKLYYPTNLKQLEQDIEKADFKNILYSSETLKDLINLKWIFFLIVGLISIEWFSRKYFGSY